MSSAFCAWPIVRMAWWIRPPPSRGLGHCESLTLTTEQGVQRDPHVLVMNERVEALADRLTEQPDVAHDVDARRVGRH